MPTGKKMKVVKEVRMIMESFLDGIKLTLVFGPDHLQQRTAAGKRKKAAADEVRIWNCTLRWHQAHISMIVFTGGPPKCDGDGSRQEKENGRRKGKDDYGVEC